MTDEATRHREKMEKRKAVQDAEVAEKSIEKGLLIVNTGPGKGKTTAALGLALRMLGRGHRVGVVQFIKGAWDTGEAHALKTFGSQVEWHAMGEGFTWETQDKARDIAACLNAWTMATDLMADASIRLLILDELNIALRYDYLDLDAVVATLKNRRPGLHVVVTGRNAKPALIEAADLVTEMGSVKHHFAAGVKAQEGSSSDALAGPLMTRALMIQGTGSDVGKSLIVAGLARVFTRRGLRVRPFKPQNMSNNAAVTADGGEIGRAQALQARAAGVAPSIHMNPVLLKPQSEVGSQVVVQGRMVATVKARDYQAWKPRLMGAVLDSFSRLQAEADLVLVEGAGSASEVNLRAGDIANMGFARATDTPVVLLGDIDRGGVIASLVGTKAVIDPEDAATVVGFLVNRFRGDPSLFADGMGLIAEHTGWASLGLIPHFPDAARLPAEDVLGLVGSAATTRTHKKIVVPVFPRIANFDDLDPLRAEPAVEVVLVRSGEAIPGDAALVLLPGSKTTIDDLAFLRAQEWDVDLRAHVRRGGRVLGLCGGYQMLGRSLADPHGIEGEPRTVPGLGLLDVDTVMTPLKRLDTIDGISVADAVPFAGYEMHVGDTAGPDAGRPLLRFSDGRADGAVSADGLVAGTYVHGLFADDRQRAAWLLRLGAASDGASYEAGIERVLDALAAHLERHVDCDRLLALAR